MRLTFHKLGSFTSMQARGTYTNLLSHTRTYYYGIEAIMLGALKTLCSRIASGIGGDLLGSPCVAFLSFIYKKKQKGGLPYKEERERMNVC